MKHLTVAVLLAACAPSTTYGPPTPNWVKDTSSFKPGGSPSIAEQYGGTVSTIIAAARADRDKGAYAKLSELTDTIGNRLSGSATLDKAIAWAVQRMKDDGLDVHTEPVMVPVWKRGTEDASIVAPIAHSLSILGLGGTVSTPKGGINAPVVVVHDWKELEAKAAQVRGAIVVYDVAMGAWSPEHGSGYGTAVEYRTTGASRAAKLGAVAALVRAATATSLSTPHTGAQRYEDGVTKIPVATVTVEDAELIDRLAAKGPVQVQLHLESQALPDAPSANVVAELRGRELPDEIVILGAHIDSWDVGQGAHDDGAGCVTMMQALALLHRLKLVPRRTIRVVLFTNEENGLRGGKAYAQAHAEELPKTVLAVEADSGGFAPTSFGIDHQDPAVAARARVALLPIVELLRDIGPIRVDEGGGGADISPMKPAGVLQVGLEVDGKRYFDYHHTNADTLDKVAPGDLAEMTAAAAAFAYVVADLPERVVPVPAAAPGSSPKP